MEKPAHSDYPLHEIIRRRWSPVAFSRRPLPADQIGSLFEAARWAPSCYNEQPWFFMMATPDDPGEFERALSCLAPGNREWARNAPLLVLTFAKLAFDHNGKPNRHAWHDIGLAVENLVLQATAMGLYAHQMAGIEREKIGDTYQVPEGIEPVSAIAIGHPGSTEGLSEKLAKRETAPRSRKPLASFLYSGKWGRSPDFLEK